MVLSTRHILYLGSVEAASVIEERKQMFQFIFILMYTFCTKNTQQNMIANVTKNNLNTIDQVIKKKNITDVWNWALTVTKTSTK